MHKFLLPLLLLPLLLMACNKDSVEVSEEPIGVVNVQMVMPEDGKAVHPEHGKEQWFAYGALTGVEGMPSSGVAEAFQFEDGAYTHVAQANLPVADEGFFYEGWLINEDTGDIISSGHFSNFFGDVRHQLQFESSDDLRDYLKIVVTLEPDDGDPAPATHVAEGVMNVTRR